MGFFVGLIFITTLIHLDIDKYANKLTFLHFVHIHKNMDGLFNLGKVNQTRAVNRTALTFGSACTPSQ